MKLFHLSVTLIIIIATTIVNGCSGSADKEEEHNQDDLIQISHEQFKAEQMQVGNAAMHPFTQIFKTNGIVTASHQSKACVHSYISGIIKSISVNLGSYVRKGQKLCTIESKEYINIQQQYLESLAKLKATESDYQRIKSLYKQKISSQKDFLSIESEYNMLNAKIKALTAELNILNVNLNNLEDGNLSAYLSILSPIEGYITIQNCKLGQFVNSQYLLMEVIDNKDLQLHFFVYQESVNKFQPGQLLNIYSPNNSESIYRAKIISIGKSIDPETRSIKCIAELEDKLNQVFISGMYFQVEVIIDTLNARAIPSEAIIKTGNKYYVLIKEKEDNNALFFRKEEIKPGLVSSGFTQIIGDEYLNDILIKGSYYYQTE